MRKQILTALLILFCGLSYGQKKEIVHICIDNQWGIVSPVENIKGSIKISNGKATFSEISNDRTKYYTIPNINSLSHISFSHGYEFFRPYATATIHEATAKSTVVGLDKSVPVGFEYVEKKGDSYDYDNVQKVATTSNGEISVTLSNLKYGTGYLCRPYCIEDGITYYGSGEKFTTKPPIETGNCPEIKEYSAIIAGKVYDVESNVKVGIIHGTTSDLSVTSGVMTSTTSKGNFTLAIYGLMPSTTYYYCAFALIDGIYYYGETKSFTTLRDYYEIGDVYPRNGTPEGVVFSVSNGGKSGKIVSLDYAYLPWDTEDLFPYYYGNTNTNSGENHKGPTQSGCAYSWCISHGSGWYMPANAELKNIGAQIEKVNSGLVNAGYPKLEGFYWSSNEYNPYAYKVCVSVWNGYYPGYTVYNSKTEKNFVVAVKAF